MKFIQLNAHPMSGIPIEEAYCIGISVPVPEYRRELGRRNDLYKFRDCKGTTQNDGIGWFCDGANKTSFKLHIKF